MTFPTTSYIEAAVELARYDKLGDGSFAGEIPKLKGVAAFGKNLRECEGELRSTLEDWILASADYSKHSRILRATNPDAGSAG